ncbi:related to MFS myo-inositol transporter [Ramularia collo-cygni]|uniref:Related to MFS myo-inositol transporter n=1 Tax=Ramularia collo-cygni TaxID=112498 RepID=A0A2D3VGI9_9PEZI|nr:related to MFS myo-inositol transporter [Ramularia collo-cygni]CZT21009.1 related to MFS myo-inositol transporter [Ramularia collo-cygni]
MQHSHDDPDANEPLIGRSSSSLSREDADTNNQPAYTLSFRDASPVIRFLTCSAGISGLLFGFDTGVISSTLVSIGSDLSNRPLTTPDKALVTAITSLLALISAPTTGFFADRFGRKSVILVPAILFTVGAITQSLANYVWTMAAGRALVGAAVGVASGAVPLYITELAPAELRGRLVTVQSLFITGGQVVAYLIGWIFASWPSGWRWMVGLGAFPALVQLGLMFWMPETPRWLLQTGQDEKARAVLNKVYANVPKAERNVLVQGVLSSVQDELREENKTGSKGNFHDTAQALIGIPGNRRALIIACMLQGLQQLCGFNSLMYFSATIFALVGFTSPIGTSLSVALTNFVFTLVAFAFIDTVGRRNILLRSIPFMVFGLLACASAFLFINVGDSQIVDDSGAGIWSIVLLLSMVFYVAAYAVGLGTVPWQQSELFPLRVRSVGSGLATSTNWSSNFVVGMSFLPLMNYLGPSTTFTLYALVCVVGWIVIYKIYPETAGLELEGISQLLKDGWSVTESIEGFHERRKRVELEDRQRVFST